MQRAALVVMLVLLQSACVRFGEVSQSIDYRAFERIGGTLFSNPEQLTMKEVHLDQGVMAGRSIIVSGQVKEISEHFTYAVLEDGSARLLVVLTGLEQAGSWLKERRPKMLRVLGTVDSGKKGLPIIMARALSDSVDAAVTSSAPES